jgi:hypothetical protein
MQEHSEHFWGIPEVRRLKPDEVDILLIKLLLPLEPHIIFN